MDEVFAGDESAESHRDIHVQDAKGRQLATVRLADGVGGLRSAVRCS